MCVPGQSRDERNRCQRAGEQKKTPEAVTKVGETPENERPSDKRTEDASELGNRRLWRQPTAYPTMVDGPGDLVRAVVKSLPSAAACGSDGGKGGG